MTTTPPKPPPGGSGSQSAPLVERGKYGATCHKSNGLICDGRPVRGSTLCHRHLVNPKARANAAVRAEVQAWRLDDVTVDAGQVMLRLLSQAVARAALYGRLLEEQYAAAERDDGEGVTPPALPSGVRALIGHKYALDKNGGRHAVEEAIRGLVVLEGEERDRAARYSKLALDAGIDERRVRVEEASVSLVIAVIRRALVAAGVSLQSDAARVAVRGALAELAGGGDTPGQLS